ncbi:MAG: GTPase Era [Alphaproteobacteria bacterium]|nr:GTPase Era [Alphaproteobacteria bacterium]
MDSGNFVSDNQKRCGFVAVLGETNAGKSTLVNKLVGQKVSIVSRKVQTTLSRILGIAISGNSQIILIDTPGFVSDHKSSSRGESADRASVLEKTAWDAFRETDDILFVVDVHKKDFEKSIALLQKIDESKKISLVLNKVDLIIKEKLLEIASEFSKIRDFENIFMISSLNGDGVKDIEKYLAKIVPEGEWLFPEDEVTDSSFEKFTSEITREHLYHRIHQEIPYRCRVVTENYRNESDGSVRIAQNIFVKSNAHKMILLGHKGSKIRAVGSASRRELSELLGREVHLFLNVVVEKR